MTLPFSLGLPIHWLIQMVPVLTKVHCFASPSVIDTLVYHWPTKSDSHTFLEEVWCLLLWRLGIWSPLQLTLADSHPQMTLLTMFLTYLSLLKRSPCFSSVLLVSTALAAPGDLASLWNKLRHTPPGIAFYLLTFLSNFYASVSSPALSQQVFPGYFMWEIASEDNHQPFVPCLYFHATLPTRSTESSPLKSWLTCHLRWLIEHSEIDAVTSDLGLKRLGSFYFCSLS